jgi:AcrR family transcriptional regulator
MTATETHVTKPGVTKPGATTPGVPPAPDGPPRSARERLLAAADELFYAEGIHTVGIDRIIERAGVAKASLYSLYGNKEGLIRAYLRGRLERRQDRTVRRLEGVESPREQLLAVYDVLASFIAEPDFHGCAFMNACAEAKPGSAALEAAEESRGWTRALFTRLAREAGAPDPETLARQLVQLYDGAIVTARMDGDPTAAATARASAAALIDAAVGSAPV